jgi:hypothetical protein
LKEREEGEGGTNGGGGSFEKLIRSGVCGPGNFSCPHTGHEGKRRRRKRRRRKRKRRRERREEGEEEKERQKGRERKDDS